MNIKEELTTALKESMKSGDKVKRSTIRMVMSAIKNAEIQAGSVIDDPTILGLVQKEIKSRQDTIEDAKRSNRDDLILGANNEIAILQEFLPKQLEPAELESLIEAAIQESGASEMKDMGSVMNIVMPKTKGRADGKTVSQIVRAKLASL